MSEPTMTECERCSGTGLAEYGHVCLTCGGEGEVEQQERQAPSEFDCHAALASRILDLVSYRGTTPNGEEYREGHDTMMYGVDEQACEIVREWAAEFTDALRELHDFAVTDPHYRHGDRSLNAFVKAAEVLKRVGV